MAVVVLAGFVLCKLWRYLSEAEALLDYRVQQPGTSDVALGAIGW